MKKSTVFLFAALLIVAITGISSCRKQAPQLPSNKVLAADTTGNSLLEMNKILALREDSIIQAMIARNDMHFSKSKSGIWYNVLHTTQSDSLKNDSIISYSFTTYNLAGEEINSGTRTIRPGKKEIPTGLEEGLLLMRKGETMQLIVPWYLGYGMNGNEEIPPYTSLMYLIVNETTSPPAP
ncbi:MAG TPA: FKBP-type peptidyl-prolyl cis-trans isomerase [Paludibacteraceae bacterium]|nr:FKBP-type peptidyl-prolyl cis-trans isomerase [Paludibacteraceae bacterium]